MALVVYLTMLVWLGLFPLRLIGNYFCVVVVQWFWRPMMFLLMALRLLMALIILCLGMVYGLLMGLMVLWVGFMSCLEEFDVMFEAYAIEVLGYVPQFFTVQRKVNDVTYAWMGSDGLSVKIYTEPYSKGLSRLKDL